jgi:hypothetical protein
MTREEGQKVIDKGGWLFLPEINSICQPDSIDVFGFIHGGREVCLLTKIQFTGDDANGYCLSNEWREATPSEIQQFTGKETE